MDVRSDEHPVREEVRNCIGTYNLQAVIEEDMQTLALMRHLPGLVAFVCTLKKDGQVIAQGYGSSVLSGTNRYITRAINSAFNSSLADSVIRATKVLDTLRGDVVRNEDNGPAEPITDRQKSYLQELIKMNVEDQDEREQLLSNLDSYTKEEASATIQTFKS